MATSNLEAAFLAYWSMLAPGEPIPVKHKFHPERKWELDFAWVYPKVAVEIEGGTWQGGRHNRPAGYAGDCRKYNAAALLGWTVLRYTSDMMENDPQSMVDNVKEALGRFNLQLQGQIAQTQEISRLNGLLASRTSSQTLRNNLELERLRTRMDLIEHEAEYQVESVYDDDEIIRAAWKRVLNISQDKPFVKLGQVLNGQ